MKNIENNVQKYLFKQSYLNEIGVLCITNGNDSVDFLDKLLFLVIIEIHVPLRQPSLTCTVLDQDEAYLQNNAT